MEKLLEKKNLGIPTALLVLLAYFIGYYFSNNLGGLLVAVIFAGLVFALNFDDKVKNAVKQAYVVGFLFALIYMFVGILYQFSNIMSTITDYNSLLQAQRIYTNMYVVVNDIVEVAAIIVYIVLVIAAFANKEIKFGFVFNILGEGTKKPSAPQYQQPKPPVALQYQQPIPPVNQQSAPTVTQQSVPPVNAQPGPITCPKCSTTNKPEAIFCASCGNKLQ